MTSISRLEPAAPGMASLGARAVYVSMALQPLVLAQVVFGTEDLEAPVHRRLEEPAGALSALLGPLRGNTETPEPAQQDPLPPSLAVPGVAQAAAREPPRPSLPSPSLAVPGVARAAERGPPQPSFLSPLLAGAEVARTATRDLPQPCFQSPLEALGTAEVAQGLVLLRPPSLQVATQKQVPP